MADCFLNFSACYKLLNKYICTAINPHSNKLKVKNIERLFT